MSNETNNTIPQDWGMYMQELDNMPSMTRTNLALFELAPIQGYDKRIQFAVYYQNATDTGLPTAEENPTLWDIEDMLYEYIGQLDVIDVGLMKWDNKLNFFLYVKDCQGVEETFTKVLNEKFPNYKSQLWVDEDSEWECYFETLYPNEYSMQEINNNKVLDALHNAGDNLSAPRPIQHWSYFNSQEDADAFVSKVATEGFEIVTNEVLEDQEEYQYQVSITRTDMTGDVN